jgi:hypothetical protein
MASLSNGPIKLKSPSFLWERGAITSGSALTLGSGKRAASPSEPAKGKRENAMVGARKRRHCAQQNGGTPKILFSG